MLRRVCQFIVAVGLLGGCTRSNPIYCEQLTDCAQGYVCNTTARECIFDGRDAGYDGGGCANSGDCTSDLPICNDDHVCVTCQNGDECVAADSSRPFCRTDGRCGECTTDADCTELTADFCDQTTASCRGCIDHDDCSSEVCNLDIGTCADPGGIIYVDSEVGTDDASCGDQNSPCASVSRTNGGLAKLTSGRQTVRVRAAPQAYPEAITLDGIDVVLVGAGAAVQPIVVDRAALEVTGGANVTVVGLTLSGAQGGADADGARCTGAGSILRLSGATVENNAAQGVDTDADCDLRITRSRVRNNPGGGVRAAGAAVDIDNSVIVGNGGASAAVGGVRLEAAGARFTHNTVAGNQVQSGGAGVHCAATVAASNSIVYGNTGAATSGCSWTYSDIEGGAAGDGNIDLDPLFMGASNFHLMTGSPCVDAGDPASGVTIDIDLDPRPIGGRVDMGADEVMP